MTDSRGKLVVVGQGYVGLPLAMRAVEVGWDVVGIDLDGGRIKRLASGDSYVEDIPAEEVASALTTGRYRPTHEYVDGAGFEGDTVPLRCVKEILTFPTSRTRVGHLAL